MTKKIVDRIVQQCILQILEPICEAKFHDSSYGFRPNRSTEHAIAECARLMQIQHLHYVVDIDIQGFFDNVYHTKHEQSNSDDFQHMPHPMVSDGKLRVDARQFFC